MIRLALIAALLAGCVREQPCDAPPPTSSVIKLHTDFSTATGVVVAQDRVLTAFHVIANGIQLKATVHGEDREVTASHSHPGLMDERQPSNDVTVLTVPTGDLPSVKLEMQPLRLYERVWIVGYPLTTPPLYITEGRYQGMETGIMFLSAPGVFGMSGSAVFVCRSGGYKLAGMAAGLVSRQDNPYFSQAVYFVTFAVPVAEIVKTLEGA